jgi:hypothetical protein
MNSGEQVTASGPTVLEKQIVSYCCLHPDIELSAASSEDAALIPDQRIAVTAIALAKADHR